MAQAPQPTGRKPSVLVVENDGMMAIHMAQVLDKAGYRALSIEYSGENAIEKIGNGARPDIVLIDWRLGGKLDSIQTAREIQQLHQIPVVFLATLADRSRILETRGIACFGFLQKPFLPEDLVMAIDETLGRRIPAQEL